MKPDPRAARIFQINTSAGGVPKLPRQQSEIHVLGLAGDAHTDENHGGVERAVCLYPLESILDLQDEGHPIYPGAMGENLTVAGLDWAAITPGVRLRLGEEALVEVTRYTAPCSNLIPYFLGGDYSRVSEKAHPGWSRVYARVLQPGAIRVGDSIRFENQ
jgi:MOSC domain-containing protein YiiM